MSGVLNTLISDLDGDLQRQVRSRVDAMRRHLAFMAVSDNRDYHVVLRAGWTGERMEILCELNSFYQVILGPLASSARSGQGQVLGKEIPIQYGEALRFDAERAELVRRAMASFMWRVRRLGLTSRMLTAARADDLIRAVRAVIDNSEGESGGEEVPF